MAYEVSFSTRSDLAGLISRQISQELFSAYHYYAAGWWLKSIELHGMAQWMFKQAQEEIEHSKKLTEFALDRDIPFEFQLLPTPRSQYASVIEVFEACFVQEKEVSTSFHILYKKATEQEDFAAKNLFSWFIEEQVEEEALFKGVLHKLHLVQEDSVGLLMLDKELGKREK